MKFLLFTSLFLSTLMIADAKAFDVEASFGDEGMMNISELGSVISNNNITLSFAENSHMAGNMINASAFENSVGVNSVNINSAAGANVQQNVSINVNGLDLSNL